MCQKAVRKFVVHSIAHRNLFRRNSRRYPCGFFFLFCRSFSLDIYSAPSVPSDAVVVVVLKEFISPLGGAAILRMIDSMVA